MPSTVHAAGATYYFSPSNVKLNVGQSATVSLFISTPDQAINSGDGTIVLPAAYVSGGSISKAGSIFTNWPEEPGLNGSSIRFAGGLPTPGYQGDSGKVLSFTIKGKAEGTGLVTLSGGRILANNATGSNIFSGAGTSTVSVTRTVSGATISSSTHPDQGSWYKARDLTLSWTKPSGVSSYSYTLSHDGAQASKTGSGPDASAQFSALADGVWTFALVTTYSDGKTANSSFTVRVDASPPTAFTTTVEQQGTSDPKPILKFKATDASSGIDHYEVLIDGKSVTTTTSEQFQLPIQLPGTHNFIVKAFDKAGNVTESIGTFTIEGFPGPVITHWPNITNVLEPLFFKGKARYDSKVLLYIDGQKVGEFVVKDNLSDDAKRNTDLTKVKAEDFVEWAYPHRGVVTPGRHMVYAHQERPDGALSNRSNEVQITILWTSISIGKYRLPTILVGFIGMALLLLILIIVWYRFRIILALIRRRVRNAEEKVDQDFESLEKDLGKDGSKIRGTIELTKNAIDYELEEIFRKNKDNKDKDKKD